MVKFVSAKEKIQKLSQFDFKQMYVKICAVESPTLRKFMELKSIAEVGLAKSLFLEIK